MEGVGRNADIFGVLNSYNASPGGIETDTAARRNDMAALAEAKKERCVSQTA